MSFDTNKADSPMAILIQIAKKLLGFAGETTLKTNVTDSLGVDRTGVCGGTKAVTPGATAFDYPSFIECTGADGTITGVDEYGNTVTTYPMTVGKITPSRFTKVTAVSAGVVCWRHYSI